MEEEFKKELFIPSGLKLQKELFPGFTKRELKITLIVSIFFIIFSCLLYMFGIKKIELLFLFPLLGSTIVAFMQVKGELNLSPIDIIKIEIKFLKDQKYYPYIWKNEWM